MLAALSILGPRALQIILSDPTQISAYVELEQVQLVVKLLILAFLFLYILFSVVFIIQIRRTEKWLMLLRQYKFQRLTIIHLVLAILGWILALIIL